MREIGSLDSCNFSDEDFQNISQPQSPHVLIQLNKLKKYKQENPLKNPSYGAVGQISKNVITGAQAINKKGLFMSNASLHVNEMKQKMQEGCHFEDFEKDFSPISPSKAFGLRLDSNMPLMNQNQNNLNLS